MSPEGKNPARSKMESSRFFRASTILGLAAGLAIGVVFCARFPEFSEKVAMILFPGGADDTDDEVTPPTVEQINQVLSGSLALVEAQHTYYVHVTRNAEFAPNIRELGSRDDKGGTVMVLEVWNASDAVAAPSPLHGYLFKSLPVTMGPDRKDGFVVAAYPADEGSDGRKWPLFLSIVPDAKGGLIGMSSRATWEINDPAVATEIRALLNQSRLSIGELERFSPENSPASLYVENFKKEAR